jgi:hypothetical protein
MSVLRAAPRRGQLDPVEHRARWIAWGIALQAIGVGIPVLTALHRAHEASVGGALTHYTVRLVWHEMLRSRADIALIVLGVVLFAVGAVLLARPFVRRPVALLVAVPLAGVAGLAVFGVVALVIAAVIAVIGDTGSGDVGEAIANFIPDGWPGRSRRK